jgi:hypothetical protein
MCQAWIPDHHIFCAKHWSLLHDSEREGLFVAYELGLLDDEISEIKNKLYEYEAELDI